MKNRFITLILILISMISCLISLTGCSSSINYDEAWQKFSNALSNSLNYEIFYWKEVIIEGKNSKNTRANVHCDNDKNGYIKDDNGNYVNLAIKIDSKVNSKMNEEIYCGLSQSNKNGEPKNFIITKKYAGGEHISSVKEEKTAIEYYNSMEFQNYLLSSKLYELTRLNKDDLLFDMNKAKAFQNGTVTGINCRISPNYLDKFKSEFGVPSILEGKRVYIELAYERIASIIVYNDEDLDGVFKNEYESYKLEVVYLGPIVYVPQYDGENMKFVN